MNWRNGYATSPDGIAWVKDGSNPVLNIGTSGSWDDEWVYAATVHYDGIIYHMWYVGYDGTNWKLGYATSPDRITWTKSASNPILYPGSPGSWDDERVYAPSVLSDGSTYHMWYSGYDGLNWRNGYASSIDGISWIKGVLNPVLDLGSPGSWDDSHVNHPTVFYDGISYHMWYTGDNGKNHRKGLATYSIKWTKLTSRTEVLDAYEITGINSGSEYTIDMEVPATADLDLFIYDSTGGRNDALASSTNNGPGIDESITFTA